MSSSYLGHGAKYWADRYFEQHTQTRLPDDPADLSWREKYLALEKAIEMIKQESRRYAKRQLTWFKRDKRIQWFDSSKPRLTERVTGQLNEFIHK